MTNISLRSAAKAHDKWVGAAVNVDALRNDRKYAETLAREYNMITAENVMKSGLLIPGTNCTFETRLTRDIKNFKFKDAEEIIGFAQRHDIKVRGHTLVWHHQLPAWISTNGMKNDKNWTKEQLGQILKEYIRTVTGRFKSKIYAWDVVNEAIAEDNQNSDEVKTIELPGTNRKIRLRNTIWLQVLGADYLETAFRLTHEADQDALLFYNDYNGEGKGRKFDDIYTLVKYLLDKGVPIHGAGLQAHIGTDNYPPKEDIAANMERFASLGLEVHITELDVRIKSTATSAELTQQAKIYGDITEIIMSSEKSKAIVTWGFTDKYSWIPYGFPGYDNGLPFDREYNKKACYYSMLQAFKKYHD